MRNLFAVEDDLVFAVDFFHRHVGQHVILRRRGKNLRRARVELRDVVRAFCTCSTLSPMRRAISGKSPLAEIRHVLGHDPVLQAASPSVALQLNEQALTQIARAHARRIKALDEREHGLEILLGDARVHRHLFRSGLEKTVVVDVADDQFGDLAIVAAQRGLVELPHQMLLQRFLGGDRIEKELPLFFVLLRAAAVAARLRHVIAPFVVELGQLIELLFEIFVAPARPRSPRRSSAFGSVAFLQHRIRFHLLLDQIAQLQQRRLQDEQALLQLRGKDLLQRQILRLIHALAGHMGEG